VNIDLCGLCRERPAAVALSTTAACTTCAREALYKNACRMPSDIHEHLPLLRKLAEECTHVTEFGTRWANGSTIAFLAAQPKTFVAWDLDAKLMTASTIQSLVQVAGATTFQPRTGNTLEITIEPTDLLFIDTLHTGKQLLSELERHCDPKDAKVHKYLVFHDTSTFGIVGEDGGPGLRTAIRQFQKYFAFPLWCLLHDLDNCAGLVVLKHVCADGHAPTRGRSGQCTWCGRVP
jgi:hypothetical protein